MSRVLHWLSSLGGVRLPVPRQLLTCVGAAAACVGALAHRSVVWKLRAGLLTCATDRGASRTGESVQLGTAQHEIRGRLTHVRAIGK
ncbi:MAG TPA: hypothetical protein VH762_15870 [Gemmatimonadaceae bacterium]